MNIQLVTLRLASPQQRLIAEGRSRERRRTRCCRSEGVIVKNDGDLSFLRRDALSLAQLMLKQHQFVEPLGDGLVRNRFSPGQGIRFRQAFGGNGTV